MLEYIMKKLYLSILILSLFVFTGNIKAQEYSSNAPIPPTKVVPVTPAPTPAATPPPSPVVTPPPVAMPVTGSVDFTFIFLIAGLLLSAIGFYKVKLKN